MLVSDRALSFVKYLVLHSPMTFKDDKARAAAIALLTAGQITPGEAAAHAGVSRQLIYAWCKRAKIDWKRARASRTGVLWFKAMRQ